MDKKDELVKNSSSGKNAKYYLTIYILPGDGTPRILPVSKEISKNAYDEIQKQLKMDPPPDDITFKDIRSGNVEVVNRKCVRLFSVTTEKVAAGPNLILPDHISEEDLKVLQ